MKLNMIVQEDSVKLLYWYAPYNLIKMNIPL